MNFTGECVNYSGECVNFSGGKSVNFSGGMDEFFHELNVELNSADLHDERTRGKFKST